MRFLKRQEEYHESQSTSGFAPFSLWQAVFPRSLRIIREVIVKGPHLSRAGITCQVCEQLDWHDIQGKPKLMDGAVALLKFHRKGWIVLPPRQLRGRVSSTTCAALPKSWVVPKTPIRSSVRQLGPITLEQAEMMLDWYVCRWQIEVFFRILKSGCRVEELQLEKIERLEPAMMFYMLIAWRVHYFAMIGRDCPKMPCDLILDEEEWKAVYIVARQQPPPQNPPTINEMLRMIAGFGGFLNRKGDGMPGPQAIWIGL